MSSIFTEPQRKLLKESMSECEKCSEKLRILRTIGLPNEVYEAQVENLKKTLEAAHDLDTTYQVGVSAI